FGYDPKYTGHKNYEVPADVSNLTVTINPAEIPNPLTEEDFETSFVYNTKEQKVQLKDNVTLPGGLAVIDYGTGLTNVGTIK
ncbi:hypothetical protein, partial [Salmonella enterica]|uniref:hypothetical protein n=1 Tax=Salmonella enterica TaxID=28901 RepID=UPI003CEB4F63